MKLPKCDKCGRQFEKGDEAFGDITRKMLIHGSTIEMTTVHIYTCAPKCEVHDGG